ncbi:hypothetical protein HYQ45_010981 [Verticillium longisporum]|uniref:Uncharacterized protein n=1 Tax=Verticillium longisporum TaxID=100787 RepID=A0A8I2ZH39_VERLO|nr:hypothetical protein HYQ45_010981 [Verticillium longisporum]
MQELRTSLMEQYKSPAKDIGKPPYKKCVVHVPTWVSSFPPGQSTSYPLQSCCVMSGQMQMPDEEAELGGGIPVFQSTRESAFYPESPKPIAPYTSGRLTW